MHGLQVAVIGEIVQRFAPQTPLLGHHLGADALVHQSVGKIIGPFLGVVAAQRLVRHHLGAAGDDNIHVASQDRLGGKVHRLLAGAAHAVEGDRRHLHREAGLEHRQPGQVGALVAQRGDTAPDHIVHAGGLDPGARHRRLQDAGSQVDGRDLRQGAAWFSDPYRGTDGGKDIDFAHTI